MCGMGEWDEKGAELEREGNAGSGDAALEGWRRLRMTSRFNAWRSLILILERAVRYPKHTIIYSSKAGRSSVS